MHRVLRVAQPLVGAALAPVALPDRVRYRAPAMARGALPFHQRETVDVGLGQATAASPGGIALDFVERELAHRSPPSERWAECGGAREGRAVTRCERPL